MKQILGVSPDRFGRLPEDQSFSALSLKKFAGLDYTSFHGTHFTYFESSFTQITSPGTIYIPVQSSAIIFPLKVNIQKMMLNNEKCIFLYTSSFLFSKEFLKDFIKSGFISPKNCRFPRFPFDTACTVRYYSLFFLLCAKNSTCSSDHIHFIFAYLDQISNSCPQNVSNRETRKNLEQPARSVHCSISG